MVLTPVEEDQAIANRFLSLGGHYENTGMTLASIAKNCAKLSSSGIGEDAPREELLELLHKCEYDMLKSMQIEKTLMNEMHSFDELSEHERVELEQIKRDIEGLKTDLKQAQAEKTFKDRCDWYADLIVKNPDRAETTNKVEQVTKEIDELNAAIEFRRNQLESKKKQFSLLFHALGLLCEQQEKEYDLVHQSLAVSPTPVGAGVEEGLIEDDGDVAMAEEGEVTQE
eukprot:TRINITY_DN10471_c0_g1_i1.p1 TRINITY_DN10471_c0_g1~~TRINITY_DN10471_c0_g1_i1.p1  ORF type:complete len:227 (+),score=75.96 TRINITY_DN10471_c0_g1_i1:30-710(+)